MEIVFWLAVIAASMRGFYGLGIEEGRRQEKRAGGTPAPQERPQQLNLVHLHFFRPWRPGSEREGSHAELN